MPTIPMSSQLPGLEIAVTTTDMDIPLGIFGQQSSLNIYTQICLCFPVHSTDLQNNFVTVLEDGLERLTTAFPWIAGQVIGEDVGMGKPKAFKIKSYRKAPHLVVKDHTLDSSVPTMDALRRAEFPCRMLDESIIAPRNTIPISAAEAASPSPVFLLQVTFIDGGLILTVNGQHQAMDMTGQGQLMRLLSKACHNEAFTKEELWSGNLPHENLFSLLDEPYEVGFGLKHSRAKSSLAETSCDYTRPSAPAKSIWANFIFDDTSLSALKSTALPTLGGNSLGFVSTDDVLSALVWQAVARARGVRVDSSKEVTFARAVDPRRHLGIPPTYAGLVQNMTYHTMPLQKLIEEPLGTIASDFRVAVEPRTSTLSHDTRALATELHYAKDRSMVSVTASLELSKDIMLSSWAKIESYDLDFNLGLGKPEAVRRPQFIPVESLIYILPKRPDGQLVVAMCLREEDLNRLCLDPEFTKYGKCAL